MKISIRNLGVMQEAELNLGDLTIICGGNNTGKTYINYALFGFLSSWERTLSITVDDQKIQELLADGICTIDLHDYLEKSEEIIRKACQAYTRELPNIFATSAERFKEAEFYIDPENYNPINHFDHIIGSERLALLSLVKNPDTMNLVVTLLIEKNQSKLPTQILNNVIGDSIKKILFSHVFPRPFIASAERTGAAIFRKELNFARNRLLEELGQADKDIAPMEILLKDYKDYPLPVKKNVDFARKLESVAKKTSFLSSHENLLKQFADIIGGEYMVNQYDQLYYIPRGKRLKLSMDESSSAVRSLLDIGFYLRHEAQKGDILMIDEPELNLHPENQRRIARLFAQIINLGVKVFITTHSDYIIKELNTLIMLKQEQPYLKRIAEEEGYQPEELLDYKKVKVYMAETIEKIPDGKKRKIKCQTLTEANIDPKLGIEARTFDKTIETMNRIQEAIIWGEE